jgi:transketolase
MRDIDQLCINTLRFLAVDQVEKARSGHPGMPLGAAPMAYVLWDRFLRHNPRNPKWFNRDRFILSAGHGSALLYALLHLYGYDLPLEELKRFRQWGSKTPGHPEYGHTPGVEATTGPLGQGFGMGVGMAIAEGFLANCFNTPEHRVVDHYIYAIVSDGDLMEGVASEAASLAGTLGLGKLIYLYDDNHISIEGETDIAFTENVRERFQAYGWHVQKVADGNDLGSIEEAIKKARAETKRPSLIVVRTHIGYGSPKQDSASAHGEPLGPEGVKAAKENLGWPTEPAFHIPEEALEHFRKAVQRGADLEAEWNRRLEAYREAEPELAEEFEQVMKGELPPGWKDAVPLFKPEDGPMATRKASGKVLNALALKMPHQIMGGSADLAPSTNTILMGYGDFGFDRYCSHNLHFGVREHAMGAIANGIALHGGAIPYTATFLVFSDYMRPTLRLAALMGTHVIFVFTHDSIGMGEDGPTHQPVEHLMSLRAIPGLTVIRPADANETAAAWQVAVERKGPVVLAFSRQTLPVLDAEHHPVFEGVPRGAYVLAEAETCDPEIVLIATGSEVHLALEARKELEAEGIGTRVVSMPSWELFEEQDEGYRQQVLPSEVPRLAIEAGATQGWCRYAYDVIGLDRFGASAPGATVLEELGFNLNNVVTRAHALQGR